MARKPMPWLRLYVEMPTDRKVRRLKPEHRWLWVCLMALARTSPMPGELMISDTEPCSIEDIADFAALSETSVKRGLKHIAELGMIVKNESKTCWKLPAWQQRQYPSDSSTDRVRAHRNRRETGGFGDDETLQTRSMERFRNVPVTAEGTRQKTETETETDTSPYAPLRKQEQPSCPDETDHQPHENSETTPERSAQTHGRSEPTRKRNTQPATLNGQDEPRQPMPTSRQSTSGSTPSKASSTTSRASSLNDSESQHNRAPQPEPPTGHSTCQAQAPSTDAHTHQEPTNSETPNQTPNEHEPDSHPYEHPDPLEALYEANTGQTLVNDPGIF